VYYCSLEDFDDRPFAQGFLKDYCRWSEQHSLFAARAIASALADAKSELHSKQCFRYLLDIEQAGRRLSRTPFAVLKDSLALANNRFFDLSASRRHVWHLASLALCADLTNSLELPAVPTAIRPHVYEFDGVRYCRSSDLPPEAQIAFERAQRGSQCPWIPGVEDAFYVQDILSFLEGSARFM
jgi:hypothetical protein